MEIRTEKQLDAAIALSRLSKTERLLRLARGRSFPHPRDAVVQLGLAGLAVIFIVRALLGGRLAFAEIVPWLILLYALYLGQRINAIVELLELGRSAKLPATAGNEPGAT